MFWRIGREKPKYWPMLMGADMPYLEKLEPEAGYEGQLDDASLRELRQRLERLRSDQLIGAKL